jgi:hypothetical protein
VAFVIGRLALAGGREWLAGARACPNRSVVWPAGETEGERPSAEPGEEMGLGVSPQIVGSHVNDASLVDISSGDMSGFDEVAEPLRCIGIVFVVVGIHDFSAHINATFMIDHHI